MTLSDRAARTGSAHRVRRAAWPALCALLVAAYLSSVALQSDGDAWTVLTRGGIVTLASLIAGAGCVMAGRRAAGVDRWGMRASGSCSTG